RRSATTSCSGDRWASVRRRALRTKRRSADRPESCPAKWCERGARCGEHPRGRSRSSRRYSRTSLVCPDWLEGWRSCPARPPGARLRPRALRASGSEPCRYSRYEEPGDGIRLIRGPCNPAAQAAHQKRDIGVFKEDNSVEGTTRHRRHPQAIRGRGAASSPGESAARCGAPPTPTSAEPASGKGTFLPGGRSPVGRWLARSCLRYLLDYSSFDSPP